MTYKNTIINVDTDSILICKPTQEPWTKEEQEYFLKELNAQFPDKIKFEHDGVFSAIGVFASKNYALLPEGETKIKVKGSSLKDQKKEPAIKEFIDKIIAAFIHDKADTIPAIYEEYVLEVMGEMKDIARWSQKKTVTEAVLKCRGYESLTPEQLKERGIRANETSIWDAIKHEELVSSGDKMHVYPAILNTTIEIKAFKNGKYKWKTKYEYGLLQPKFWTGNHDREHLLKRLYSTLDIFTPVLDLSQFKNYSLVKNYKELLDKVSQIPDNRGVHE